MKQRGYGEKRGKGSALMCQEKIKNKINSNNNTQHQHQHLEQSSGLVGASGAGVGRRSLLRCALFAALYAEAGVSSWLKHTPLLAKISNQLQGYSFIIHTYHIV